MCRNIKILFNFEPPVTPDEIRAASLQFVRKITGFNKPSQSNEAAFLAAIDEVSHQLLAPPPLRSLPTPRRRTAKKKPLKPKPAPPNVRLRLIMEHGRS
jgi:hypothetical protein